MNLSQVTEIRTLLEIDNAAESLRASLEDTEWRIANSPELDRARTQFEDAALSLAEAKKDQRRLDGEIAGLTAKIEPEEKRLYDGSVKNPKELTAIQHELDLLKDHRSKLEDELLEVLATVEEATAANKAAKAALASPDDTRASISALAFDLGYASLGPFNRAFKDATGLTPSAWRIQALARSSNPEKTG